MCVLRVNGLQFLPDDFLEHSPFETCAVFRAGEPQFPGQPEGRKNSSSGFHVDVSDASWATLEFQVRDAERFLLKHETEFRRLASFAGVEEICLDFPLDFRIGAETVAQSDTFPASFVRVAGQLGIALTFSLYAVSDSEESGENSSAND